MVFVLIGANYNDIPLEQLESLEHHTNQIRETLLGADNASKASLSGGVVIGTCNRFEVYLDTENYHQAIDETVRVVSTVSGLDADYVSKVLRVSYGSSVAQHLYSVTSGLDSMVVGEAEIAGQVKRSLQEAQTLGQASSALNSLFQTAASVAKKVTTQTGLGAAGRSIIATGLELHEQRHGSLRGKTVVLFGTGAYARVAVAALQRAGVTKILVQSESGRAEAFSDGRGTFPVERGQLRASLAKADLIVTASGSRNYSISYHLALDVLKLHNELGLTDGLKVVDVALAQSVAPNAYELAGVEVMDLAYIHRHAPAEHAESLLAAREIVTAAVAAFEAEQTAKSVDPIIARLRGQVSTWVEDEVERVRKRSGEETATEVARSLNRVANVLLHAPTVNAKELAKAGNHEDYLKAVKTLFGIDLQQLGDDDE